MFGSVEFKNDGVPQIHKMIFNAKAEIKEKQQVGFSVDVIFKLNLL